MSGATVGRTAYTPLRGGTSIVAMFRWRYLDAEGVVTGTSEAFADRALAEAWLGESWAELLAGGVERVVLVEDGRELYRMGLRET